MDTRVRPIFKSSQNRNQRTSSGGYIGGGIGNDGNDLITAAHGKVVVVQMQYRIGVFGFLAGVEVKEHGVLNAGLCMSYSSLSCERRQLKISASGPAVRAEMGSTSRRPSER